MRLYAVYAPVHHAAGKVHATAADAEQDENLGNDEPPTWSVQPVRQPVDEHASPAMLARRVGAEIDLVAACPPE
jgi:hypothetical protein